MGEFFEKNTQYLLLNKNKFLQKKISRWRNLMYVQEDVFLKVCSGLNLRPSLFTVCKVDVVLLFRFLFRNFLISEQTKMHLSFIEWLCFLNKLYNTLCASTKSFKLLSFLFSSLQNLNNYSNAIEISSLLHKNRYILIDYSDIHVHWN